MGIYLTLTILAIRNILNKDQAHLFVIKIKYPRTRKAKKKNLTFYPVRQAVST